MQSLATRRAAAPFATQQRASRPRAVRAMAASSLHEFKAKTLEGEDYDFSKLKGKVALITNVACACGLTNSNYKELTALHDKYGPEGLEVIAFPCNQFGAQESGSPEQIRKFVTDKYGVKFTMMEKVDVNGPKTHPVWVFLKEKFPGDVDWNFRGKFVIDKDGNVVARSADNPSKLEAQVKELLAA